MSNYPQLSQVNALGQGFDIFGTFNVEQGSIRPLFDTTTAKMEPTQFLGETYDIPAFVSLTQDTSGNVSGGTYTSRQAVQHSFAANAGVKASYMGLFSAQFEAAYRNESEKSSEYDYSYRNTYTQVGYATIQTDKKFFSQDFIDAVSHLPDTFTPKNRAAFFDFFDNYGAFYISKIFLGSCAQFYVAVNKESGLSTEEISASMKASYHGLFVSGEISAGMSKKDSWQKFSKNASANLLYIGGDAAKANNFLNLVLETFPEANDKCVAAYEAWTKSLNTDVAVMDFAVSGIWNLCGSKNQAVEAAWQAYYRQRRPMLDIEVPLIIGEDLDEPPLHLPKIHIGNLSLTRQQTPKHNRGLQVIVLDGNKDITQTDAALVNNLYSSPTWTGAEMEKDRRLIHKIYEEVGNDLSDPIYRENGNILILASFSLQMNMLPNEKEYLTSLLKASGASADDLSQFVIGWPNMSYSEDTLSSIIYVGVFGSEMGTAVTLPYTLVPHTSDPDAVLWNSLRVMLYTNSTTRNYTIGDPVFS